MPFCPQLHRRWLQPVKILQKQNHPSLQSFVDELLFQVQSFEMHTFRETRNNLIVFLLQKLQRSRKVSQKYPHLKNFALGSFCLHFVLLNFTSLAHSASPADWALSVIKTSAGKTIFICDTSAHWHIGKWRLETEHMLVKKKQYISFFFLNRQTCRTGKQERLRCLTHILEWSMYQNGDRIQIHASYSSRVFERSEFTSSFPLLPPLSHSLSLLCLCIRPTRSVSCLLPQLNEVKIV